MRMPLSYGSNNNTGMTSQMASHVYTDIYFPMILQTHIDLTGNMTRLEIHSLGAVTSLFGLVQVKWLTSICVGLDNHNFTLIDTLTSQ